MNPEPSVLYKKFISQTNKKILWDIMTDNNIFKGISGIYNTNVQTIFEQTVMQISAHIIERDDILSLNKQVILKCIDELHKYKLMPVTAEEVSQKKQDKFQRGLETKKEEFNKLIQPPKPDIIDFSDKLVDEPIGSEMDIKLAQTIAWRETQLSQVLEKQDTTKANDWIKNGQKSSMPSSMPSSSAVLSSSAVPSSSAYASVPNTHIKIGNITNLDENSIINIKKVSFANAQASAPASALEPDLDSAPYADPDPDSEPETANSNAESINFMDKLKKKDVYEEITLIKTGIKILSEKHQLILENQEQILNILLKKYNLEDI